MGFRRFVAAAAFVVILPGGVAANDATALKYRNYGTQYYKAGKYKEAVQYYEASLKLKPDPALADLVKKTKAYLRRQNSPAASAPSPSSEPITQAQNPASTQPGDSSPWRFGAHPVIGYAMHGLGDLHTHSQSFQTMVDSGGGEGASVVSDGGIVTGLEAVVFGPFGLGLGLGYLLEMGVGYQTEESYDLGATTFRSTTASSMGFNRIPITLYYRRPAGKLSYGALLGVDMLSASITTDQRSVSVDNSTGAETTTGELNMQFASGGLGFRVGVMGGYAITPNFELTADLGYMVASVTDFAGSASNSTTTYDQVSLHMIQTSNGEMVNPNNDEAGPPPSDSRPFTLDMSGLRLNLGLRMLFP